MPWPRASHSPLLASHCKQREQRQSVPPGLSRREMPQPPPSQRDRLNRRTRVRLSHQLPQQPEQHSMSYAPNERPQGLILLGEALGSNPSDHFPLRKRRTFAKSPFRTNCKMVKQDSMQVAWAMLAKTVPPGWCAY